MALLTTTGVLVEKDFNNLYKLFSHIYGPNSHRVVVNHQTVSSSNQLFHAVNPSSDVINLLFSFLKQQLHKYKDGGCFTGLLATSIIQRLLKEGSASVQANPQQRNDSILEFCVKEIRSSLSWKCNIGRFADVAKIIRSILVTKLKLTKIECKHLCLLLARVFTMSDSWRNCHVIKITDDGKSDLIESQLEDGLLLRLEQYSMLSNDNKGVHHNKRVICFSISIALDSEEMFGDEKVSIETGSSRQIKNDIMQHTLLNTVCTLLVGRVDLIICQKVIHPRVKAFLRDHGIEWVDRVGGAIMPMLSKICACQPVNNLKLSEKEVIRSIGRISSMERVTREGRFFLKLNNDSKPEFLNYVKTLLLCSRDETSALALESCYEQVLVTLETIAKSEKVVGGGGCTLTQLVKKLILMNWKDVRNDDFENHSYCSIYVDALLKVCQALARSDSSLHHKVDFEHFHHWIGEKDTISTCCCGKLKRHPDIKLMDFLEIRDLMSNYYSSRECSYRVDSSFSGSATYKPSNAIPTSAVRESCYPENPTTGLTDRKLPNGISSSSIDNIFSATCTDITPGEASVVESEEILIYNLASAFQLANMVLRIGSKVVSTNSNDG